MPFNSTFANDLLKLILWGTAIADIAENDTSSPLTNLYMALHTADPGAGGDQTTNEISYTGYARVAIPRDNTGFAISANIANPAAHVDFPTVTAGTGSATHVTLGTVASGAGKVLARGTLTPNLAIIVGQAPRVKSDTTITALTT